MVRTTTGQGVEQLATGCLSSMQFIFDVDIANDEQPYQCINGKAVVIVRQLNDHESDQVEWFVVPVDPILGHESERWVALPSELIPLGVNGQRGGPAPST